MKKLPNNMLPVPIAIAFAIIFFSACKKNDCDNSPASHDATRMSSYFITDIFLISLKSPASILNK